MVIEGVELVEFEFDFERRGGTGKEFGTEAAVKAGVRGDCCFRGRSGGGGGKDFGIKIG